MEGADAGGHRRTASGGRPTWRDAPALVGGDLSHIWIYLTAPFVGAVVGWGLFRAFDRLES